MDQALIISDSPKATEFYKDFLTKFGIGRVLSLESGEEAKRRMVNEEFQLCIINSPIHHDLGEQLALDIASGGRCQVLFFVKTEFMSEVTERVSDFGVLTVEKPINKQLFWNALQFARVAAGRVNALENEIRKLRRRLEDERLASRAKCILMEQKSFSEEEAHRHMEKQAMDQRISRRELAERIIDFYQE